MAETPRLISSQRHRDNEIIAEKRKTHDYGVFLSPAFELFGEQVQVVLDGHHSWDAAILDNVEPEIYELNASEDDRVELLIRGKTDDFLEATRIDSDLYDLRTGHDL